MGQILGQRECLLNSTPGVVGVVDPGVRPQLCAVEQEVDLEDGAVVAVVVVHAHDVALPGGQHGRPDALLGEGGVAQEAGRPVELEAAGRPSSPRPDVGRLVGLVAEEELPPRRLWGGLLM